MFHKADLDDDGFVTPEDFYNIMTGKVYWNQWKIYNIYMKLILNLKYY